MFTRPLRPRGWNINSFTCSAISNNNIGVQAPLRNAARWPSQRLQAHVAGRTLFGRRRGASSRGSNDSTYDASSRVSSASTSPSSLSSTPGRSLTAIDTLPPPTCPCGATPSMPFFSPIDVSRPLAGTAPRYAEQVLICTGPGSAETWGGRIEEDGDEEVVVAVDKESQGRGGTIGWRGNMARELKGLLGRGGEYADPYHNVLITNVTFPSAPTSFSSTTPNTSAYLVPSFKYIPHISVSATNHPSSSTSSLRTLIKEHILPETAHPAHPDTVRANLTRQRPSSSSPGSDTEPSSAITALDVHDVLILICGHGSRDVRCGIYGTALQTEFERALPQWGIDSRQAPPTLLATSSTETDPIASTTPAAARVGLISHIGGHKFAGNVIIYIPPRMKIPATENVEDTTAMIDHPFAGCGIWYGRVQPQHVEGIVRETILGGRVVRDLFRGGMRRGGEVVDI